MMVTKLTNLLQDISPCHAIRHSHDDDDDDDDDDIQYPHDNR